MGSSLCPSPHPKYTEGVTATARRQTERPPHRRKWSPARPQLRMLSPMAAKPQNPTQPNLQRFISRDPMRSGNRYTYVRNRPTCDVDPSGEMSYPECVELVEATYNGCMEAVQDHNKGVVVTVSGALGLTAAVGLAVLNLPSAAAFMASLSGTVGGIGLAKLGNSDNYAYPNGPPTVADCENQRQLRLVSCRQGCRRNGAA